MGPVGDFLEYNHMSNVQNPDMTFHYTDPIKNLGDFSGESMILRCEDYSKPYMLRLHHLVKFATQFVHSLGVLSWILLSNLNT